MRAELLDILRKITDEEQAILDGRQHVQKELYTDGIDFVVDSAHLLSRGQLVTIRPHTRFVRFPRHRHNYVELVYMCSGQTTHIINGGDMVVLHEGDLLFMNQSVYHEIFPAREEDIAVNFIILPEFLDRSFVMLEKENVLRDFLLSTLSGSSSMTGYLHIEARDIVPVQNLLENMIWTLLNKASSTNTLNQTTMGLLLLNLTLFAEVINRSEPDKQEENTVFAALKYIETHYRSGTLADMARELHQPTYAISRVLKKYTGLNFKELLGQRKLQQAAYLLTNTDLSHEAILAGIGYENSSFFYNRFREKYGCTPAEYRTSRGLPGDEIE